MNRYPNYKNNEKKKEKMKTKNKTVFVVKRVPKKSSKGLQSTKKSSKGLQSTKKSTVKISNPGIVEKEKIESSQESSQSTS